MKKLKGLFREITVFKAMGSAVLRDGHRRERMKVWLNTRAPSLEALNNNKLDIQTTIHHTRYVLYDEYSEMMLYLDSFLESLEAYGLSPKMFEHSEEMFKLRRIKQDVDDW